jgi:hypothetical protein
MAKSLKQHKTSILRIAVRFEGNFAAVPLPLLKKVFIKILAFSRRNESIEF